MSILEDPTDLTDGEEESEDQLSMKRLDTRSIHMIDS